MSQKPKGSHSALTVVLTVLIVLMLAATAFLIYLCIDLVNKEADVKPSQDSSLVLPTQPSQPETTTVPETTVPPTTEAPEPEHVVATASISTQGDLLMHKPVFASCQEGSGYDFTRIFKYSKDLISGYDYAIANLETTFGGDKYTYQGNPAFNCPDGLADGVKDTGYDMLLTVNNHAGDTMGDGMIRTIETVRAAGLASLGTQLPGEKRYSVVDINGIKVGMVAYSWAYGISGNGFSLNGLAYIKDEGQANYFSKQNPDKLYNELKPILEGMKEDGAEATMIFIHWGEEYEIKENAAEDKMAQKLCDLGFDVIIGGASPCGAAHGAAAKHGKPGAQDLLPVLFGQCGFQSESGHQRQILPVYRVRRTAERDLREVFRRQGLCGGHRCPPILDEYALQERQTGI